MSDPGKPRPSPEVAAVLRRVLQAMRDRDMDALRNLCSHSSLMRAIGSDADEFWDAETFLPILKIQLEEMPLFEFSVTHIEAFEFGDFAWGALAVDTSFVNGPSTPPMRFSAVFVMEDGMWRFIQLHTSIPVDNKEALGVALTTTLTDLLDSLDADSLAPISGAEGTATLMFTDIEDSTVLAQEMGDKLWSETIEDHDRFVVATVKKHAGTVIKTLGDGALVAFGSARNALRCGVDLQSGFAERPFAVRIGIHTGEVIRTEADVVGLTVNKAARIAAAAGGGQVVISSIVRDLVGTIDDVAYNDPFLAELKGIEGVHELIPLDLENRQFDPASITSG